MHSRDSFELRFEQRLREYAAPAARLPEAGAVARAVAARPAGTRFRRGWPGALRGPRMWVWVGAILAATLGIGLIAGRLLETVPPVVPILPTATAVERSTTPPTVAPATPAPPTPAAPTVAPPRGAGSVLAVSAGNQHTCAIGGDGILSCWGMVSSMPPTGSFVALGAGEGTCAIRTDGELVCWPEEYFDEPAPAGTFSSVSVALSDMCAIRTDGTLGCSGEEFGPPPAGTYTAVSVGENGACAIETDGTLACWGIDAPTPPAGSYIAVATGALHACAIRTDGGLACWGQYAEPAAVAAPAGTFTAVDAGVHTCAIRTDGTLACWGSDPDQSRALEPPPGTFRAVSVGGSHACAIATDDTLTCWGDDESGQLEPRPVAFVMASSPFADGRYVGTTSLDLSWAVSALAGRAVAYDVRYQQVRWDDLEPADDPFVTWRSATAETGATFDAEPGHTYVFEVRAHMADGSASDWAGTSSYLPADDVSLARSGGWRDVAGPEFYGGSATTVSAAGATLTLPPVGGAGIALIATTCPECGTVEVYRDDQLLGELSLFGATRTDGMILPVTPDYDEEFEGPGTITIKVVVGKPVIIDGIAVIGG
jgi:Regulator of chromosome condensation (RCC1) repeat